MEEMVTELLKVMKNTGADEITVSGYMGKDKRITVKIENLNDEEE